MAQLRRLGRYLMEAPEGTIVYEAADKGLEVIEVFVDSDWARWDRSLAQGIGQILE